MKNHFTRRKRQSGCAAGHFVKEGICLIESKKPWFSGQAVITTSQYISTGIFVNMINRFLMLAKYLAGGMTLAPQVDIER